MNRLLIILVLATTASTVAHAQHLGLTDASRAHRITHPQYLEDKNGTLTFHDVTARPDMFIPARQAVPDFLGNLSKVIWYRFTVTNQTNQDQWFLEIKGGYMHRLTLYRADSAGKVSDSELVSDGEFDLRPVKSNNLIFPAPLAPGQTDTFYLRATSRSLIRASMSFSTMQQLYESSVLTSYGNGFLTALAAALLLYNLFVYFSLREKVYLYYILYISLYIIHNNLVSGTTIVFFPWSGFLNSNILLPLMGCASILFTNSFLQTRRYAPVIYSLRWVMTALFAVPLLIYFAGYEQLAIALISFIMYVLFVYWFAAGIIAYCNAFRPAIYYIAGFGALIVFNTLFGFKIMGWWDENYWIDSALYVGTAMEALILSFALAKKINFYKQEKEEIKEQALQQAVKFSHELIDLQEGERKRIASELHDSVGQKLIVIKNKVLLSAKANGAAAANNALADNVSDVIQEIRSISYALRPYQMDLLGFTRSVRSLAEEIFTAAGINYDISADNIDGDLPADKQMNVYRIIQECLNNIVKHSRASHCSIGITKNENTIIIKIEDNGIGFDGDGRHSGFGLKGMKERLQILNGSIATERALPSGTISTITLPTT